jgi:hypothetical protein
LRIGAKAKDKKLKKNKKNKRKHDRLESPVKIDHPAGQITPETDDEQAPKLKTDSVKNKNALEDLGSSPAKYEKEREDLLLRAQELEAQAEELMAEARRAQTRYEELTERTKVSCCIFL